MYSSPCQWVPHREKPMITTSGPNRWFLSTPMKSSSRHRQQQLPSRWPDTALRLNVEGLSAAKRGIADVIWGVSHMTSSPMSHQHLSDSPTSAWSLPPLPYNHCPYHRPHNFHTFTATNLSDHTWITPFLSPAPSHQSIYHITHTCNLTLKKTPHLCPTSSNYNPHTLTLLVPPPSPIHHVMVTSSLRPIMQMQLHLILLIPIHLHNPRWYNF